MLLLCRPRAETAVQHHVLTARRRDDWNFLARLPAHRLETVHCTTTTAQCPSQCPNAFGIWDSSALVAFRPLKAPMHSNFCNPSAPSSRRRFGAWPCLHALHIASLLALTSSYCFCSIHVHGQDVVGLDICTSDAMLGQPPRDALVAPARLTTAGGTWQSGWAATILVDACNAQCLGEGSRGACFVRRDL